MPNKNYENHLMYLLQDIYFDNIDTAKADEASEAMHNDVRWVHNQVWEHDAHKSNIRDAFNGRKEVREFLRKRIIEMQIEGIIHKVENVAALEIESFYNNYEGVMISQVIGVDDERLGEVPALFIEKKEGANITAEELIESAKGKISNFKIPRYVVFVDDWPMSSTKVQKFKLKEYDLGKKVFG